MTHLDLFSGIGGFALACKWAGIETVQFVEIDPFCQKVLKKNFPGVPIHEDIRTFTNAEATGQLRKKKHENDDKNKERGWGYDPTDIYQDNQPFLITGGFPCQPFSCAGKRKGDRDDRFLWPQMLRVIKEFQPTWVIGENVAGIASMVLTDNGIEVGDNDAETQAGDRTNVLVRCITDLEAIGYEVQTFCIPACSLGAPHRRDRMWIVARNAKDSFNGRNRRWDNGNQGRRECSLQIEGSDRHAPDSEYSKTSRFRQHGGEILSNKETGFDRETYSWNEPWIEVATRLCGMDDGVSDRVHRLKALGNAIVPQVAYQIIKAIRGMD